MCERCAVLTECHSFALRIHEPYGIWGGLAEHERAQLSARQAGAGRPARIIGADQ
jgi:WhiB family redox-sensing transcriptional regulator